MGIHQIQAKTAIMPSESERSLLLAELQKQGIKHHPNQVIRIAKKPDETIIFLETGNSLSGLQHILENHRADFLYRNITEDQITDLVIDAVVRGKAIGTQGTGRIIYEIMFNGKLQYVSVTVGSNGYIVGANPTPKRLISQLTSRKYSC